MSSEASAAVVEALDHTAWTIDRLDLSPDVRELAALQRTEDAFAQSDCVTRNLDRNERTLTIVFAPGCVIGTATVSGTLVLAVDTFPAEFSVTLGDPDQIPNRPGNPEPPLQFPQDVLGFDFDFDFDFEAMYAYAPDVETDFQWGISGPTSAPSR